MLLTGTKAEGAGFERKLGRLRFLRVLGVLLRAGVGVRPRSGWMRGSGAVANCMGDSGELANWIGDSGELAN